MTHKTTMPDPVGYQWLDTGHFRKNVPVGSDVSTFNPLITTDQAEAYKDACVREALLEAYGSMQDLHMSLLNDANHYVHPVQVASFAANRISALIPNAKED